MIPNYPKLSIQKSNGLIQLKGIKKSNIIGYILGHQK